MTDLATLKSLRERVLAASGPDRGLDADIANAFRGQNPTIFWGDASPITASIDAALALAERVLNTGRNVEDAEGDLLFAFSFDYHCSGGEKAYSAELNICREYEDGITVADQLPDFRAYGRTLPLAILAALISALIAQGGTP